ncbi:MAG: hypothetical protein R3B48_15865 [Kofleriaceae bacterium]
MTSPTHRVPVVLAVLVVSVVLAACGGAPAAPVQPVADIAPAAPAPMTPLGENPPAAGAPAAAKSGCEASPRRREFDFWLGRWEVRGKQDAVVGHNRIEAIHGGCALLETWTSSRGGGGSSLNFFDPERGKWRQVWVDHQGGIIDIEGGLVGGAMILEGTTLRPGGTKGRIRGTWTPMPDGKVRQVFEEADDAGVWSTTFDGMYAREP